MKSAVTPDQQGVPAGSAPFPSQPPAYAINLPPGAAVYPSPPYGQVPMPPGHMPFQTPVHMPSPVHPQYPPQMPVAMPMPAPERPPDCPPGLEYLVQIDQLLVHQQMELMEVMMGFETHNKYLVKNSLGQQVFFAEEENDCFSLHFCGPMRSFAIHIQDNMGQTVMSVTRPLKCGACCFPCCLQELEVQSPPGNPIGYVIQDWHPYIPKFTIQDERRNSVLRIIGPFCDCKCFSDVNFEIKSLDETSDVGRISKQWSGFGNEMFTDADNFGVQFPMDLDVKMKATILGACFLIDFMFFEHSKQQDNH